jgi:hypothetical protein
MRDFRWMRDLTPDEARAAIAALDKQPPPDTVRGILEMRAMREALMAKSERRMSNLIRRSLDGTFS